MAESLNRMEDMRTPFLLRLNTFNRAVGVPRSVKTVPKLTVSVENASVADEESVKSSLIHEVDIKPNITSGINKMYFISFIYKKRFRHAVYCAL